jgi:hypothetical protein
MGQDASIKHSVGLNDNFAPKYYGTDLSPVDPWCLIRSLSGGNARITSWLVI